MLLDFWLDQPVSIILALIVVFFLATGSLIHLLVFSRWTGRLFGSLSLVAPFFTAIALLFGLLTGFLASDAWERNRLAGRAVVAERDVVLAIHALSIATLSDMTAIRSALRNYATLVVSEEWVRMEDGDVGPQTSAALTELLRELADPKSSHQSGLVAHSALLDLGIRLVAARGDRLSLAGQRSSHAKWWTVIGLAVLTQLAIALVHAGKATTGLVAVGLFSLAAVLSLSLIATSERPFDGATGIKPVAMRAALEAMAPP